MSPVKLATLAFYAVLALLAITLDGTVATWSLRLLLILAVAHAIEVLVFFKVCRDAPGSLPGHLLSVFLFGIFHVKELKAAQGG
ncbi:MAG: hypothetical protein HKN19_08005 [Halioglobus sp.]|nr:hypothetical protein [Halioglobus sp.]